MMRDPAPPLLEQLWYAGISVTGIAVVTALDRFAGPDIALSIFYALPVAFVAWHTPRRLALFVALLAAGAWLSVEVLEHHYSHPVIYAWNGLVRLAFFVIIALLLVRLRATSRLEQELAYTDPLTGAANGRSFRAYLERRLNESSTDRLGIAYIDLDNFKQYNDRAGHADGDALLVEVVVVTQGIIRQSDMLARLGGDEFAIIVPECDFEAAQRMVLRVHGTLTERMHQRETGVSFSIGLAFWDAALPPSADAAVRAADDLMYRVKHGRKNGVLSERNPAPAT